MLVAGRTFRVRMIVYGRPLDTCIYAHISLFFEMESEQNITEPNDALVVGKFRLVDVISSITD